MLRPLFVALQLLTRLPTPRLHDITARETGWSVLFYPVAGLIIGGFLILLNQLLLSASPGLTAALLLASWVLITGALHLDGLGDSADAWLGGHGNRERTLEIMKDPRSGPAAVVAIALVLLLKFAALQDITSVSHWLVLLLIPVLSRTLLVLLFLTTPYVRAGGMGEILAQHLPRRRAWAIVVLFGGLTLLTLDITLIGSLIVGTLLFIGIRRMMIRHIGGTTGDTAGALVELTETGMLVAVALLL
ncbi:MAG: adenosylcobinamide-GDP ribazoletransferase [Pseudomonadota bacterium]